MNMHVKTEGKFKVGDRVRVVDADGNCGGYGVGDEFVLTGVRADSVEFVDNEGDHRTRPARRFELAAPAFKVGDRVRVSKIGVMDHTRVRVGDTGVVDDVAKRARGDLLTVRFSPEGRDSFMQYAGSGHFEPAPLTIRAGGYYKTRDGRKVGPMRADLSEWSAPSERGALWHSDGRRLTSDGTYPSDLVAEWPTSDIASDSAEATPPIAEQKAGKFKVGDRVVYDGHTAVVREVLNDGRFIPYLIEFETDAAGYGHNGNNIGKVRLTSNRGWWVDKLTFASDPAPNPAIVAKLDNGQPKPATRPYVHADTASATAEASRLAGAHKGQEFGVYELVATRKEEPAYEHEWQRLAAGGETKKAARALRESADIPLGSAMSAVAYWLRVAA